MFPLRALLIFGLFAALARQSQAADFNRRSTFESVEAFAAAAAFKPAAENGDLFSLFAVEDGVEGEHGKRVTAATMQACSALWADDDTALLMAVANPPTEATQTSVGVLFLLVRRHGHWRIGDLRRFIAAGKYAKVFAELTAGVGTGYQLGSAGMAPVVTVKESHGGYGYSYEVSASYRSKVSRLKRIDL